MFADSSTALCPSKMERVSIFHRSRPQDELHLNCYRVSPSTIGSSGVGGCVFRGVSVWREATRQPQPTNWLWVSEEMATALIYGYVQVYRIVDAFRIIAMDDPDNIRLLRALYARDLEAEEEERVAVLRDISRFDLAYRVVTRPAPHGGGGGGGEMVVRSSELENDRIVADWLLDRCAGRCEPRVV